MKNLQKYLIIIIKNSKNKEVLLHFKLAKETEQYELQNRKLMSKFRQLMN